MNDPHTTTVPILLLVEDDPVSATFLSDAAALLSMCVRCAGSMVEARQVSCDRRFDLLLIDAHLPDGLGIDLLHALRGDGQDAPALAHTAEHDHRLHEQLLDAGFREVLHKPLSIRELHAALRRHLEADRIAPCWDDAVALAALGGHPEQVAALRKLFLDELPIQRARIGAAFDRSDATAVCDELHRLSASCGFVGASQLADVVRQMRAAPLDSVSLCALEAAMDKLLGSPS